MSLQQVDSWFKRFIYRNTFSGTFYISALTQIITITSLNTSDFSPNSQFIILLFLNIIQWTMIIIASYVLSKHIWITDVTPILYLYLATMLIITLFHIFFFHFPQLFHFFNK